MILSIHVDDYGLADLFDAFDELKGWSSKEWNVRHVTNTNSNKLEFRPIPNTTTDNPMNKEILRHITKVIFHKPATIVYFDDGDKVVVKTYKDNKFNPEAGLALCILKKMLGNDAEKFHKFFKDWKCNKYYD